MRIQFLGSGDAFGSGGRMQACIYVQAGGEHLLLDCGASSLIAMKRWRVSTAEIDAILISHLHGDHFGGIPFFLLEAQFISGRNRPLTILGPPGIEKRLGTLMEALYHGSTRGERKFAVEFIEFEDGKKVSLGASLVTPYHVLHGSGAPPFAIRVECEGKAIAYSGDTAWTDALVRAARATDVFICECWGFDEEIPSHLNYTTLMKHRARLECGRLILTHMGEEMLAQLPELDVEFSEDGKIIEV